MKYQNKTKLLAGASVGMLSLSVFGGVSVSGVGSTSGNVQLNAEVATAIAMKIASPNDTNPDCLVPSGSGGSGSSSITYGTANRYATSNGAEGSKQVDTFDGTAGGADELNTNTSCATLTMSPNTFSSTYSDITVYTNSPSGYALSVRSADNTSPNLVNTTDNTIYIPAGALTEQDGTRDQAGQKVVPGAQNKWAVKADHGILDTWTAITTTDQTVRSYDTETNNGSTTRVTYGISSGNNPTGKYATTLTYTATMFDGPNSSIPSADTSSSDNVTFSPADFKVPYNETRSLTITPNTGHYISSITCTDGYTCTDANGDPIATGTDVIGPVIAYVTSTNKTASGTITTTTAPIPYSVSITGDSNNESNSLTLSSENLSIPYGESRTVTVTPNTGYYLDSVDCANGYTCEKDTTTGSTTNTDSDPFAGILYENVSAAGNDAVDTGESAIYAQNIKITNNDTLGGGSVSFKTAPRHFAVSVSGPSEGLDVDETGLSITYGHSANVTITPSEGHYLSSISCPEGYTCTHTDGTEITTGASATTAQTIRVSNRRTVAGGTVTLSAGTSEYAISLANTNTSTTAAGTSTAISSISVPYGESKTLTVTPSTGYYLSSYSCPTGYTCTKSDNTAISTGDNSTAQAAQTIKIENNNTTSGGTLSFTGTKRNISVAVTPSANATLSTNSLAIPYGGSKTFTITPNTGYYLTNLTCSSGYTCSTPTYGSASNPNATSRGQQTITVTNNSTTNTGAVSFTLDNKYRISYSKTNITNPSASYTDVSYGGSTTVTVTPASGYYLSAFSGCPSGWTCSGVGTGTGYTGNQTLTLKNNSSTNTGTLTMVGTISTPVCSSNISVGTTCRNSSTDSTLMVKLADGHFWTKNSQGKATWANAASLCPSGTSLPSNSVFQTLSSKYSGDDNLYPVTGWSGGYWSSTSINSNLGYLMVINVPGYHSGGDYKTSSNDVVCYR